MSRVERAVACFDEGFHCSQAVLSTYGPRYGLDRETALRVSGLFGAGMARSGETCGVVTGALMVLGLKYGWTTPQDREPLEQGRSAVREFVTRFKLRNGSLLCRELLGYDLSIDEEMRLAEDENLFATRCAQFVRDAAEILEEILL